MKIENLLLNVMFQNFNNLTVYRIRNIIIKDFDKPSKKSLCSNIDFLKYCYYRKDLDFSILFWVTIFMKSYISTVKLFNEFNDIFNKCEFKDEIEIRLHKIYIKKLIKDCSNNPYTQREVFRLKTFKKLILKGLYES